MNPKSQCPLSRVWVAIVCFSLSTLTAFAQNLLANGSFEDGEPGPLGWDSFSGAAVVTNGARLGHRCADGDSPRSSIVWKSQAIAVLPQADYRLAGWLRCLAGEARLGIDLLDDSRQVVRRVEAPRVGPTGTWQYSAVEWNASRATSARVWFRVKGRASLDAVELAPLANSFLGNKSVEGDARGRIPFWSEERTDSLLPGHRGGELRLDTEVKRHGQASAQLVSTGEWFAVSSVNYPVPAWTDRFELSGWARGEDFASAQLLACWTDDQQKVLRVDPSPPARAQDWQRLALIPPAPPSNAYGLRLVAVARAGRVWFDDFELLRLPPRQRTVRVFVNQIGYDLTGPKTAIVAANFFPRRNGEATVKLLAARDPREGWVPPRPTFSAEDGRGWNRALPVPCAGRVHGGEPDDWGWYFWRADFSTFRQPGRYRLAAQVGEVAGQSHSFALASGAILEPTARSAVDFFYIQRCGFEVPGWHEACHLDDAKLPDGTHLDLTGGWHSAGDYNKLMYEHGDGGVVWALLRAQRNAARCFAPFATRGQAWPDVLEEAHWGARFVAKMQVPVTGALRHHVHQGPGRAWTKWSAPEVHTDNVIGTDDDPVVPEGEGNSPWIIGGWARLSVLLDRHSVTNDYLARAIRLWDHATKNGTQAGGPHLLLSTLDLHRVTARSSYRDYAQRSAESLLAQQVMSGPARGAFGSYGELSAAALAQFALNYPDDLLRARITGALSHYLAFCVSTADNPFGLSQQTVADKASFFPADLGNNFQWLARAWAAALIHRLTGDARALAYAADHLDWVLGKNPLDLCMFEGKGAMNPPRYHHRYNAIAGHERGAVPGTIPNGFVRDMGLADRPGFDLSRGGNRSPSFRTSEPWLVHNLYYLLAASEMHRALHGPY